MPKIKIICPNCKNTFWDYKSCHRKYCSHKCHYKYITGKKRLQISGKKNWRWKGGIYKNSEGYVLILKPEHPFLSHPGGYVYEHRLVVEKQIGRYLLPEEQTHHLGKKDDNRPQMLMAFINNSAHKRFHKNPNNVKSNEIIFDGRNYHSNK